MALRAAREALQKAAVRTVGSDDNDDEFRNNLMNVAQTTLSSKLLTHEKEKFAELAVSAILRLRGQPNLDYIKVITARDRYIFFLLNVSVRVLQIIKKPGGTMRDSFLESGFILEKSIGAQNSTCISGALARRIRATLFFGRRWSAQNTD